MVSIWWCPLSDQQIREMAVIEGATMPMSYLRTFVSETPTGDIYAFCQC
jgi:hypothetical protein